MLVRFASKLLMKALFFLCTEKKNENLESIKLGIASFDFDWSVWRVKCHEWRVMSCSHSTSLCLVIFSMVVEGKNWGNFCQPRRCERGKNVTSKVSLRWLVEVLLIITQRRGVLDRETLAGFDDNGCLPKDGKSRAIKKMAIKKTRTGGGN